MEILKTARVMQVLQRLGSRDVNRGMVALSGWLVGQSCVPPLDDDLSLVQSSRVLAVMSEPAEAGEGDLVRLTALVATAADASNPGVSFSFCLARKPLSELGPVDPTCLDAAAPGVVAALGTGESVEASIDRGACSLFGPRRPSAEPGAPAGRAVDPDPSGGFYQPVIASLPGQRGVLGGVRLDCGLAGADRAQVIEYNQRHRPNQNPSVDRLELDRGGGWEELPQAAGSTLVVERASELSLRVGFGPCEAGAGCSGAETYVVFDAESRLLDDRVEDLFASWYATAGQLEEYRTAPAATTETWAENRWVAPPEPQVVDLWVVLRDGRGGVGWSSYRLQVE